MVKGRHLSLGMVAKEQGVLTLDCQWSDVPLCNIIVYAIPSILPVSEELLPKSIKISQGLLHHVTQMGILM